MRNAAIFLVFACVPFLFSSCTTKSKSGVFSPQTVMSNRSAALNVSKTAMNVMSSMTQMLSTGASLGAPPYNKAPGNQPQRQPIGGKDADGYYTLPSWTGDSGESISCKIKPTPDFFEIPGMYTTITIDAKMNLETAEYSSYMTFHTVENFHFVGPAPVLDTVTETGTSQDTGKFAGTSYSAVFSGNFDASTRILNQSITVDLGNGYTASVSMTFSSVNTDSPYAAPSVTGTGTVKKDGLTVATLSIANGASYYSLEEENNAVKHQLNDSELGI